MTTSPPAGTDAGAGRRRTPVRADVLRVVGFLRGADVLRVVGFVRGADVLRVVGFVRGADVLRVVGFVRGADRLRVVGFTRAADFLRFVDLPARAFATVSAPARPPRTTARRRGGNRSR